MVMALQVAAQVPNSARKKPAKKTTPKPVVEAPPPPPAPPKEPTLEETKAWILEKLTKYKPIVYVTSNLSKKNDCEFLVTALSFDENDQLILHLKSDPSSSCYRDQLQSVKINFSLIDIKKTNAVESTKRVLLFPQNLNKPFYLQYSATSKEQMSPFNVIIAFDKGSTYEPNLATRLAKAFSKMYNFKTESANKTEAY